uniref:Reverse transcriptase zinc-binding domain-containing protein n=1 Tax=Cajanus cajan TaxID=3821 RepID=A0A151RGG8_CAJCA|nr:hypothetical protein KK1_036963 [Cajanus cajan]
MELENISVTGRRFIWYMPNGMTRSKIDRILISRECIISWYDSTQHILDRNISNHCPILLKNNIVDWGPKSFGTLTCWFENEEYIGFVKKTWNEIQIRGWGKQADISLLQYADDTMFFGEANLKNIIIIKSILRCFELISGLKVNFSKSRFGVTGVENSQTGSWKLPQESWGLGIKDIECFNDSLIAKWRWRLYYNGLQTISNLLRRNVKMDATKCCSFCLCKVETTSHIFFSCKLIFCGRIVTHGLTY